MSDAPDIDSERDFSASRSSEERIRTIDDDLDSNAQNIAQFIQSDCAPPAWEPDFERDGIEAWDQSSVERLAAMRIPKAGLANTPELSLYGLGKLSSLDASMQDRIHDFTSGADHIFLANASGSGKTRLIFETLAQHWGIYFTCFIFAGECPCGSSDLPNVLSDMYTELIDGIGLHRSIALSPRMSKEAASRLRHNQIIARRLFDRLILARLMLFKKYLDLVHVHGIPDADARYKWLVLQLCPSGVLGYDPFQAMLACSHLLSDDEVSTRLSALARDCSDKIAFVALDETQHAFDMYRVAFATSDHRRHAPLLRELLVCLGDALPSNRLIVSGSRVDVPLMAEALRASRSKIRGIRHFYAMGHFQSQEQCSAYIAHFLGDVSEDDCCTIYTWLRGRYRMVALLVTFTLLYGTQNIMRVLDTVLLKLTGYARPESEPLHTYDFKDLHLLMQDDHIEGSPARDALRKSLVHYAIRRSPTTCESDCADLVRLSAGLYGISSTSVVVFEPVVFLCLVRWFAVSKQSGVHSVMRRKLDDNALDLQNAAFVEGLAQCIWNVFFAYTPLLTLLRFSGIAPSFVHHQASIVLPRLGQRRKKFAPIPDVPERLVRVARTPDDVFDWLNGSSEPFLIPDADCAADLLFALELHDGNQVLVSVHTEFAESRRKRRDLRVVPKEPTEFYPNHLGAQQKLLDMLAEFPPLPLGSRKRSRTERHARFPVLRLLCFRQPWRDEAYDPPVAMVDFARLLELQPPQELELSDVERCILDLL